MFRVALLWVRSLETIKQTSSAEGWRERGIPDNTTKRNTNMSSKGRWLLGSCRHWVTYRLHQLVVFKLIISPVNTSVCGGGRGLTSPPLTTVVTPRSTFSAMTRSSSDGALGGAVGKVSVTTTVKMRLSGPCTYYLTFMKQLMQVCHVRQVKSQIAFTSWVLVTKRLKKKNQQTNKKQAFLKKLLKIILTVH